MTFQRRQNGNLQKAKQLIIWFWHLSTLSVGASHLHQGVSTILFLGSAASKKAVSLKQDSNNHFLFEVHLEAFQDLFAY